MADCRSCGAEVHGIGCPSCEPAVDVQAIAAIEQTPRWAQAAAHHVAARSARHAMVLGVAIAAMGGGFMWLGGTIGIFLVGFGVVLIAGGGWQARQPLRRWPAVVLTTTRTVSRDGKGRSTIHHRAHVRDRDGAGHSLAMLDERLDALEPGQAIIAFTRGDRLEEAWPVPTPAVTTAAPGHDATAAATAALAAVDLDAVAEAEARPPRRPLRAYRGPLISVAVAVALALVPVAMAVLAPGDEHATTREVVLLTALTTAAVTVLTAIGLLFDVRRAPVTRHLVVLLAHPGETAAVTLDTIDARGQRRRWPTTAAVRAHAPLGVPVLLCTHREDAIAVQELVPRAELPRAIVDR